MFSYLCPIFFVAFASAHILHSDVVGQDFIDVETSQQNATYFYHFFPLKTHRINFQIKSKDYARITLTNVPEIKLNEIFLWIGGVSNQVSGVWKNHDGDYLVYVVTPNILSPHEFKSFWMAYTNNILSVGKGGEELPFIMFRDLNPLDVKFIGIGTKSKAFWKIKGSDTLDCSGTLDNGVLRDLMQTKPSLNESDTLRELRTQAPNLLMERIQLQNEVMRLAILKSKNELSSSFNCTQPLV